MGQKLKLDSGDTFFEHEDEVRVSGIAGSCYCCSQQVHVHFEGMEDLPLAKVNKEYFYIFICDLCEDDLLILNEDGVTNISYDALWIIQEPLEKELVAFENENGSITDRDRNPILIRLYREAEQKMASREPNKYLEKLTEDTPDEPKTNSKNKKNS